MIRVHKRCGAPVSYAGVSTGYAAQCPECYEDVYLIETRMRDVAGVCDSCMLETDLMFDATTDNYHCCNCFTEIEEVVR